MRKIFLPKTLNRILRFKLTYKEWINILTGKFRGKAFWGDGAERTKAFLTMVYKILPSMISAEMSRP